MKHDHKYISVGVAASLAGLDSQTIRKLADTAQILCYRTPSGQRRIDKNSLQEMCTDHVRVEEESIVRKKCNFTYARVSTRKQLDDLHGQIAFIRRPEYAGYVSIRDIASGINFKRKGLSTILESCLRGDVGEVVVASRDRLCRFGFELIQRLVHLDGGKITVLDSRIDKTCEQELAEDLLAIVHIFSCRQMGRRSHRSTPAAENSTHQNIPHRRSKDCVEDI